MTEIGELLGSINDSNSSGDDGGLLRGLFGQNSESKTGDLVEDTLAECSDEELALMEENDIGDAELSDSDLLACDGEGIDISLDVDIDVELDVDLDITGSLFG